MTDANNDAALAIVETVEGLKAHADSLRHAVRLRSNTLTGDTPQDLHSRLIEVNGMLARTERELVRISASVVGV